MKHRVFGSFLVLAFFSSFPLHSIRAQDSVRVGSRPLTPEEIAIADSIFQDIGTAVVEGVPPTSVFGTGCEITMINTSINGSRRLAYDVCLVVNDSNSLRRIRFFDVRPGKVRRELFIIVILQRGSVRTCEFHIDRGFRRGEDPNGQLFYYQERVCRESLIELDNLINQFMNRP